MADKVYWIHSKDSTDPLSEGYVGITGQELSVRFMEHKHNRKNKHLRNRCNLPDTIIELLQSGLSDQEARDMEASLRPIEGIGWNIAKGGSVPPNRKGKVASSNLLRGGNRTPAQKLASERHSRKMQGNNHSGERKNKVIRMKSCEWCSTEFQAREARTKYCCLSCSAQDREQRKLNRGSA